MNRDEIRRKASVSDPARPADFAGAAGRRSTGAISVEMTDLQGIQ